MHVPARNAVHMAFKHASFRMGLHGFASRECIMTSFFALDLDTSPCFGKHLPRPPSLCFAATLLPANAQCAFTSSEPHSPGHYSRWHTHACVLFEQSCLLDAHPSCSSPTCGCQACGATRSVGRCNGKPTALPRARVWKCQRVWRHTVSL